MAEGVTPVEPLGQVVLQKRFPQARLLSSNRFVRYCDERGVAVNQAHLERPAKEGLVRPLFIARRERTLLKRVGILGETGRERNVPTPRTYSLGAMHEMIAVGAENSFFFIPPLAHDAPHSHVFMSDTPMTQSYQGQERKERRSAPIRMRKNRRGRLLPLSFRNLALVNLFTFFGSGSCSSDLQNAQMLLSPTGSNPRSLTR